MKHCLTFLILFTACRTTKAYKPTTADINTKQYKEVSLQHLLQSKGLYHGQYIQTKGLFQFRFEESAIYYDTIFSYGDTTIKYRDYCGLWIELNTYMTYHQILDSLKDKLVTFKGYFDTTKTGHVGGCYRATLTDAFGTTAHR
jgi:hypothetical protein